MSESTEPELDADGLVIQRYNSKMLVVVPPEQFSDQILRYVRSSLYNIHVGTDSVAADAETEVKGRLQDEFLVDYPLADAKLADYTGLVLVACEGSNPLAQESKVLDLVREADRDGKLITTWGNGLEILIAAGILKGKKVTGSPPLEADARRAGAKYSGREVQSCGRLVTARDEGAGMRLGQAVVDVVRISDAEERWGTSNAAANKRLVTILAVLGLGGIITLGALVALLS